MNLKKVKELVKDFCYEAKIPLPEIKFIRSGWTANRSQIGIPRIIDLEGLSRALTLYLMIRRGLKSLGSVKTGDYLDGERV